MPNDSKLLENQTFITETKLSSFDIEDEDIYKIIKTLHINKAHGYDKVSIRMLKLCDKSIVKPPPIIFKNCKLIILFKYIDENELLNPNQSEFRPFDSCVNQLLSINHQIFSNFDCDPPKDISAVFLDISKAFDKSWLPGLIFKIKSFGISGDLLELINNFLSNRF